MHGRSPSTNLPCTFACSSSPCISCIPFRGPTPEIFLLDRSDDLPHRRHIGSYPFAREFCSQGKRGSCWVLATEMTSSPSMHIDLTSHVVVLSILHLLWLMQNFIRTIIDITHLLIRLSSVLPYVPTRSSRPRIRPLSILSPCHVLVEVAAQS